MVRTTSRVTSAWVWVGRDGSCAMTAISVLPGAGGRVVGLDLAMEHLGQVRHRGPHVRHLEHLVTARVALPAHDLGLRILHVAELERARRAGLRAGRHDVAITQRLAADPALVLGTADPLHAEGALLHHAASPDRDL